MIELFLVVFILHAIARLIGHGTVRYAAETWDYTLSRVASHVQALIGVILLICVITGKIGVA